MPWNREFALEAKRAHKKVARAIKGGRLIPGPCEVCGTRRNIHAHHDDYTKPLEVRWLCSSHHQIWHLTNEPIYESKPERYKINTDPPDEVRSYAPTGEFAGTVAPESLPPCPF